MRSARIVAGRLADVAWSELIMLCLQVKLLSQDDDR